MTAKEKVESVAPAVDVAVAVSCDYWRELPFDAAAAAPAIVSETFFMAGGPARTGGRDLEFSVVLTDDETIRALNRDYRGKDSPTNVLSFAALEGEDEAAAPLLPGQNLPAGDVILAYETIEREAKDMKIEFRAHYTHMLVHGTLHLLGYDHEDEEDAEIMENLEIRILSRYGIGNPYAGTGSVA